MKKAGSILEAKPKDEKIHELNRSYKRNRDVFFYTSIVCFFVSVAVSIFFGMEKGINLFFLCLLIIAINSCILVFHRIITLHQHKSRWETKIKVG